MTTRTGKGEENVVVIGVSDKQEMTVISCEWDTKTYNLCVFSSQDAVQFLNNTTKIYRLCITKHVESISC